MYERCQDLVKIRAQLSARNYVELQFKEANGVLKNGQPPRNTARPNIWRTKIITSDMCCIAITNYVINCCKFKESCGQLGL